MRARGLFAAFSMVALVSGCAAGTSSSTAGSHQQSNVVSPATSAAPTTVAPRPAPRPHVTPAATHTTSAPTAAASPRRHLLVERLAGIGDARQVVAVTARRYGTSYATVTAFARTAQGWRQVYGPWTARIGGNGFAPERRKREGDGRTPTGVFGFQFMFGVEPNPGVRYPYRLALSTSWWDDDAASVHYNEWVDSRTEYPGRDPEAMRQVPAYRYGAVIGYNLARTPGLGSAIFLHVAHTGATSGCVSLPQPELLAVLRWLDPAQSPRIVMGTMSAVVR